MTSSGTFQNGINHAQYVPNFGDIVPSSFSAIKHKTWYRNYSEIIALEIENIVVAPVAGLLLLSTQDSPTKYFVPKYTISFLPKMTLRKSKQRGPSSRNLKFKFFLLFVDVSQRNCKN